LEEVNSLVVHDDFRLNWKESRWIGANQNLSWGRENLIDDDDWMAFNVNVDTNKEKKERVDGVSWERTNQEGRL